MNDASGQRILLEGQRGELRQFERAGCGSTGVGGLEKLDGGYAICHNSAADGRHNALKA
jgi:hypothetical protein